jgi:hypothetical protein
MQANRIRPTARAAQGPRHARTTDAAEPIELPVGDAVAGGPRRRLLVWSAVTLLAAIALALAIVLANLASAPADPAPPPKPPTRFGPSMGHARPE